MQYSNDWWEQERNANENGSAIKSANYNRPLEETGLIITHPQSTAIALSFYVLIAWEHDCDRMEQIILFDNSFHINDRFNGLGLGCEASDSGHHKDLAMDDVKISQLMTMERNEMIGSKKLWSGCSRWHRWLCLLGRLRSIMPWRSSPVVIHPSWDSSLDFLLALPLGLKTCLSESFWTRSDGNNYMCFWLKQKARVSRFLILKNIQNPDNVHRREIAHRNVVYMCLGNIGKLARKSKSGKSASVSLLPVSYYDMN